jgi:hypothetical protein
MLGVAKNVGVSDDLYAAIMDAAAREGITVEQYATEVLRTVVGVRQPAPRAERTAALQAMILTVLLKDKGELTARKLRQRLHRPGSGDRLLLRLGGGGRGSRALRAVPAYSCLMHFPDAGRCRVRRLGRWLQRPYRVLLGREDPTPRSRVGARRDGIPWWLPVGLGVGIVVYATVLTVGVSTFGAAGVVLVTLLFVDYCARLRASAIATMR